MAHTCPRCRAARAERRTPRSYLERAALATLGYHPYRCIDCERRFLNRPSSRAAGGARQVEAAPPAKPVPAPAPVHVPTLAITTNASRESRRRRRARWIVDAGNTPLGRSEVYALVLTVALLLLAALAVLRLVWPDAVGGVKLGGG